MELIIAKPYYASSTDTFAKIAQELDLNYYASEAAKEMEFVNLIELEDAIKRSIELLIQAKIPVEGNFKRIYTCSNKSVTLDWKLSILGYLLVCLNGSSKNEKVARMQISILKEYYM